MKHELKNVTSVEFTEVRSDGPTMARIIYAPDLSERPPRLGDKVSVVATTAEFGTKRLAGIVRSCALHRDVPAGPAALCELSVEVL